MVLKIYIQLTNVTFRQNSGAWILHHQISVHHRLRMIVLWT